MSFVERSSRPPEGLDGSQPTERYIEGVGYVAIRPTSYPTEVTKDNSGRRPIPYPSEAFEEITSVGRNSTPVADRRADLSKTDDRPSFLDRRKKRSEVTDEKRHGVARFAGSFLLSAALTAGVGYGGVHTVANVLPFHSDSEGFSFNPTHDIKVVVDGDKFAVTHLTSMTNIVGKL